MMDKYSGLERVDLTGCVLTVEDLITILSATTQNLAVKEIIVDECSIDLGNDELKDEIIYLLQQNCSITKLSMEGNEEVDDEFLERVEVELIRNQQIRENIFPVLVKHDKKLTNQKKH
jgi:hypothetical protein